MKKIFDLDQFQFPYNYKFPGQASDEKILYITRENKIMLLARRVTVIVAAGGIFLAGQALSYMLSQFQAGVSLAGLVQLASFVFALAFLLLGWWWVSSTWKKSLALVTTKRLTKFIYTTPASRHSLSLPLEMIVDTGAYTKGFFQTYLGLGTFTARSSAASSGVATDDNTRINKKYFYIENIRKAEDLQHYVAKLLAAVKKHPDHLDTFRPFIPDLKGESRAQFIKDNFPDYWS
ncbi:MAG: hypothetical protein GF381_00695 [Candidatus Pacebacteria bacterium]|nr:hypothetical protein [Candidatus Paceibacterota bacterium]